MPQGRPHVGLFVTCVVDLCRPAVGVAAIGLLEAAGCQLELPRTQTCCDQPDYNSRNRMIARDLAWGTKECGLGAINGIERVFAH